MLPEDGECTQMYTGENKSRTTELAEMFGIVVTGRHWKSLVVADWQSPWCTLGHRFRLISIGKNGHSQIGILHGRGLLRAPKKQKSKLLLQKLQSPVLRTQRLSCSSNRKFAGEMLSERWPAGANFQGTQIFSWLKFYSRVWSPESRVWSPMSRQYRESLSNRDQIRHESHCLVKI